MFVFEFFTNDSFTLWESHYFEKILNRVNLFCLVFSFILSLIYLWKNLICCLLLFYWFVEKCLFFVVVSFWFSTITRLLFIFCDSLSNDKYEKKKNRKIDQTWQYNFEKTYCTIRRKTKCVTIQFRENVLYNYNNEFVSMMYF